MNELYHCDHEETEVRVKTTVDNRQQYRLQCLKCGGIVASLKKADALSKNPTPEEFDDELKSAWFREKGEILNKQYKEKRDAWWDNYQTYLDSEDWVQRRAKVLQRDRFIC